MNPKLKLNILPAEHTGWFIYLWNLLWKWLLNMCECHAILCVAILLMWGCGRSLVLHECPSVPEIPLGVAAWQKLKNKNSIFQNLSSSKKCKDSVPLTEYGLTAMIGLAFTAMLFAVSYFMEQSSNYLYATTGFM